MGNTSSIGQSPMATTHPANYRQKVAHDYSLQPPLPKYRQKEAHSGKTAQITGRADKAWAVAQVATIYKWPD